MVQKLDCDRYHPTRTTMNYYVPFNEQRPESGYKGNMPIHETAYPRHLCITSMEHIAGTFELSAADRPIADYELFFVNSGTAVFDINLKDYKLERGQVYGLYPGFSRHLKFNDRLCGYYISFSREFCQRTCLQAVFPSLRMLPSSNKAPFFVSVYDENLEDMELMAGKMIKEYDACNAMRMEILQGLFLVFMTYLSRWLHKDAGGQVIGRHKDQVLSGSFLDMLQKHIKTRKQVSDYAAMLYVTPGYLNKAVKKVTGFTASYHIQQQVLLEAKRKAVYSTDSMKEIAFELGFVDLYHFSKFFKRNSGINFTNFRKEFNMA